MTTAAMAAAFLLLALPLKEESPGLRKQAKVSFASACKKALARVSGATIVSAEIEREGGRLIYSLDLKQAGHTGVEEVHIDAMTGAVLSVEHEGDAGETKVLGPESRVPMVR